VPDSARIGRMPDKLDRRACAPADREHEIAEAIRTDNGPALSAVVRWSPLAVPWIKLAVTPGARRCRPPEQHRRHTRVYRTLKQEMGQPPAANRRKQQQMLNPFHEEYNGFVRTKRCRSARELRDCG
jgi:hypothetical protein